MRQKSPENDRKQFWLFAILFGAALRILLAIYVPENYTSPEARQNYLVRSQAVLDGKLPYRDFWDSKPPLWAYTFAAWGKLFGVSVFSLKMLVITCEMLFVFLLFRFAQHLFRDPKLGLYTALLYAFLPQVLFVGAVEGKYESLTFIFFISALWLTLQKRPWLAALIIGVGLGFKYSVALIILPAVLLLLKKQKHSWRQIAILTFMPFCVLVLILSPFLILSPDTFLQYTIGNFVQAQEFPARIAGLYNDTPGYHAISIWGALRDGLGIIAPPYLPYLCQLGIVAILAGMLIRAGKKRTVDSNGKVK